MACKVRLYKNINFKSFLLCLICLFVVLSSCVFSVIAEDDKPQTQNEPSLQESVEKENQSDEINDPDKSDITTKIYRSSDNSLEVLEDSSNVDPTLKSDVLSKEELINKNLRKKNKSLNKTKNIIKAQQTNQNVFLPWVITLILIFFLSLIFKFVTKK